MGYQLVTPEMCNNIETLSYQIRDIIQQGEGFAIQVYYRKDSETCFRTYFEDLSKEHQTKMDLKYFAPFGSLTIQNILFENRHKGIGTKILTLLKEWARAYGIKQVIIESVLSIEMSKCAIKNGFMPDRSSGQDIYLGSMFDETIPKQLIFAGNYVYDVEA